ncbi:MAG: glutamine--tRNA ligase/YqeY domain fusion protein [bacterium]
MGDTTENRKPVNFIEQIIREDLSTGAVQKVVTRFPPEPNGYLHIGHAKSICLNFGLAEKFGGVCNLRFDDTNPEKEEDQFVKSIIADVAWLGFAWDGDVRYASDYFAQLYDWAVQLIKDGKAYVCELNAEQTREYRGTFTEPGKNSPWRDRPVAESLDLLEKMKRGEVEEGAMTLRAKIDMTSPNLNLRDPVLYRIKKMPHHRTGDAWNIYPSYDFAHGQEDAIEGVTHSICTLEFEAHRPLYDWFVENLPVPSKPRQYEFGRLNLTYTVTSKRKLKQLVDDGLVDGWDDPRMPTIAGMRRRGITPAALRRFCDSLAVAKTDGVVDIAQLEHFVRDDLNHNAARAMAVLKPLKVVITNLPEDHLETIEAPRHPDKDMGSRELPFTREIFIDQDDFKEEYSKKFKKKFCPGRRIRLRNSYVIQADDYVKDDQGNVVQVNASLIPDTLGQDPEDGDKPKGVVHWVSASHGIAADVQLYERLFNHPDPESGEGYLSHLNEQSLTVLKGCMLEPSLADAEPGEGFQFEREGYFCRDSSDSGLVFNLTIGLRDSLGT